MVNARLLRSVSARLGPCLVLVAAVAVSGLALLGVLPLDAARPAATEGRLQAEIDVLLGVEADNEGGDVDDLQHGAREGGTWLGEVTWSVTPHADPAPDTCGQR